MPVLRNHTYVNYNGKKEFMGEAEDIRTFNISTNIGFGIEYPLSKSIHIKVEPGFKYYLQSLSKSEEIDFKPYSFTFSTGFLINIYDLISRWKLSLDEYQNQNVR